MTKYYFVWFLIFITLFIQYLTRGVKSKHSKLCQVGPFQPVLAQIWLANKFWTRGRLHTRFLLSHEVDITWSLLYPPRVTKKGHQLQNQLHRRRLFIGQLASIKRPQKLPSPLCYLILQSKHGGRGIERHQSPGHAICVRRAAPALLRFQPRDNPWIPMPSHRRQWIR